MSQQARRLNPACQSGSLPTCDQHRGHGSPARVLRRRIGTVLAGHRLSARHRTEDSDGRVCSEVSGPSTASRSCLLPGWNGSGKGSSASPCREHLTHFDSGSPLKIRCRAKARMESLNNTSPVALFCRAKARVASFNYKRSVTHLRRTELRRWLRTRPTKPGPRACPTGS